IVGAGTTAPAAHLAPGERLDRDGLLDAGEGFLETQLEIVAQVGAARRILPGAPRVHEVTENGRENVREAFKPGAPERVLPAAVLERRLAEAIVSRALLRVLENVIGFADRLKACFLVA